MRSDELARRPADLFAAADEIKTGERALTQLEVATGEGSVFVVREGKTVIAATTGNNPTAGLVFYDLKSALRTVKPAAQAAATKKPAVAKKKTATAPKKKTAARKPPTRRSRMRRSIAALLGIIGGMLAGAAFIRRQAAHRERADLYFEDGSMLSLTNGSPGAERLLPLARDVIRKTRST